MHLSIVSSFSVAPVGEIPTSCAFFLRGRQDVAVLEPGPQNERKHTAGHITF